MKVVIPGGSGQVGTILARALHGDGHEVVVLSRRPDTSLGRAPRDGRSFLRGSGAKGVCARVTRQLGGNKDVVLLTTAGSV
jgi:uncharacterized protein YbjT (DUF2867 family)